MAKVPHEALHHIFRDEPGLFSRAMSRILDEDFPEVREVSVINGDLTEIMPVERHADTILKVDTDEGEQLLVIEPQTEAQKKKIRSWAYYIAYLENKYELPVTLLVITASETTARWARGSVTLGPSGRPSMRVLPFVFGPDNTPFITKSEVAAADVVFAVFAALTHRLNPEIERALSPLAYALSTTDIATAQFLAEFTDVGLGDSCARSTWKRIIMTMTYPYASKLREELESKGREEGLELGLEQGQLQGQAKMVLAVLDRRGIVLTDAERERISSCTDEDLLLEWGMKAGLVSRTEELFGD
ncbi:hypothetical protein [Glycomyces salinus]|uniref:hypothetical protein n=1 Tax=Glycomyces salinus TaxID=980294 RepID=UPI0018ED87E4|nr:hypothetical protein [Glycomyces salinus]